MKKERFGEKVGIKNKMQKARTEWSIQTKKSFWDAIWNI